MNLLFAWQLSSGLRNVTERLEGLGGRSARQAVRDARQNRRLDELEREVLLLGAGMTALFDLLCDKGVVSRAEIDAAVAGAADRALKAAEAEAAAADAEARAAATKKARSAATRRRLRS